MDCEKIGKFIAKIRKEKNMTQKELADKLNLTDRAISRWERGNGCPDLSLLIPLSKELGITVNDLLSGEIIENKKYRESLEENIVNMISKVDKKNNWFKLIAISIIILSILYLFTLFYFKQVAYNQLPVITFSTLRIKSKANDFYKNLKIGNYVKINNILTDYYENDIWRTNTTGYSKKIFLGNLKKLEELGISYTSFKSQKQYWNGKYFVDYKLCFKDKKNNNACIIIAFDEVDIDQKLSFWASTISKSKFGLNGEEYYELTYPNEVHKVVMDVFNPIWDWTESTFDNFILPFPND